MAAIRDEGRTPRAVIHKRILDVAGERPDASMAEIADEVGGASVEMVERVLAEYGDPGEESEADADDREPEQKSGDDDGTDSGDEHDPGSAAAPTESAESVGDPGPPTAASRDDADGLTEKQLEVLRLVHEHPDASQRELGGRLGVSASTVHNRLAGVDGFEWDDRWEFVRRLFEAAPPSGGASADRESLAALRERVEALEEQVAVGDCREPLLAPSLVHKVAHACMASDRFDEDEELSVLRVLMGGERNR